MQLHVMICHSVNDGIDKTRDKLLYIFTVQSVESLRGGPGLHHEREREEREREQRIDRLSEDNISESE